MKLQHIKKHSSTGLTNFLVFCFYFAPVTLYAEEKGNDTELPAIKVSARRHEETETEIPFSIKILDNKQIQQRIHNWNSNQDLAHNIANLNFVDLGATYSNVFNIRGVGAIMPLSSDDASVLMYLNDMPRAATGAPVSLLDVAQIEVLRGPQGTLFGRNTQGGAIRVIPTTAQFKNSASTLLEIGQHGRSQTDLIVNRVVTPALALRLAARHVDGDGQIYNRSSQQLDGAKQIDALRLSLNVQTGPDSLFSAYAYLDQTVSTQPRFVLWPNSTYPQIDQNPASRGKWKDHGYDLKYEQEFGGTKFTANTNLQLSRNQQIFDLSDAYIYQTMSKRPASLFQVAYADYSRMNFFEKTINNELRLDGQHDAWRWTAGVHWFKSWLSNTTQAQASAAAMNFATTQNGQQLNQIDTQSKALFAELNYLPTPNWQTTLGVRYNDEAKVAHYRFRGNGHPLVVTDFQQDSALEQRYLTGRASLSYDSGNFGRWYLSLAEGASSAGFPVLAMSNPRGKDEPAFAKSSNRSYEIGVKTWLWQHRIKLHSAVFLNQVNNGHLVAFDPASALLKPVSLDYQTQGAELEVEAKITDKWLLSGSLGYTASKLRNVAANHISAARNGEPLPNVPKLSAQLDIKYLSEVNWLGLPAQLTTLLSLQHKSRRSADIRHSFDLPGYTLLNARINWQHQAWNCYGYVNNLTNRAYQLTGQAWSDQVFSVRPAELRQFGLGLSKQF